VSFDPNNFLQEETGRFWDGMAFFFNVSLQENLKYSYTYSSHTDKVVMTDDLQTL
jgi:hypothetical protein